MNVTTYPKAYQSAFREACFVLDGLAAPQGVDVGIYTPGIIDPLGVKRIYALGQASVNAAPYVRELLAPEPLCGCGSGVFAAQGRSAACSIGAPGYASASIHLTAGTDDAPLNALLSESPRMMKIRPGEKDELSVITGGNVVKPVITFRHDGVEYTDYLLPEASGSGVMTCVVDMDEIGKRFTDQTGVADSEMTEFTVWLHLHVGSSDIYLSRNYECDRVRHNGQRLAWINSYGAIDYYTFPYAVCENIAGSRERIYTSGGYRTVATASKSSVELLSERVDNVTAGWLAGIFSSPRVWEINGSAFKQIEVAAGAAVVSITRPGVISVSVSSAKKTVSRKF